jgi:retron-type reverse transcriptase
MAIAAVRNQLKTTDLEKVRKSLDRRYSKTDNKSGLLMKANQDKWILDADIKGFFDNINHK